MDVDSNFDFDKFLLRKKMLYCVKIDLNMFIISLELL